MQRTTETIKAITKFLFIGKSESELKDYELVIFLGNDDIDGNAKALKLLWDTGHISNKSRVILSGDVGTLNQGKSPEAERLYDAVIKLGLPEQIFELEKKATNAYENLKFSRELVERTHSVESYGKILLIGRAFMGRRAMMAASALNFPINRIDYYGTVDYERGIASDTWWQNDFAIQRVLEEIRRIADYSLKGDLSIF